MKQITESTQALIDSIMPLIDDGIEGFAEILEKSQKESLSFLEVVTRLGAESSITVSAVFPTYQVTLAELDLGDSEETADD